MKFFFPFCFTDTLDCIYTLLRLTEGEGQVNYSYFKKGGMYLGYSYND